jgi:hypothetical protein
MDSVEAKPIPGTEGAVNPFFSLDSQSLGFFAGGKLQKVSISGGAPVTLTGTPAAEGASWGSHGMIAFQPGVLTALYQVPDSGGGTQPLSRLEKGESALLGCVPCFSTSPVLSVSTLQTNSAPH